MPKCQQLGEINDEAAKYLTEWCQGTLKRYPKPTQYEILKYRYAAEHKSEVLQPGTWQIPRRRKRFDLTLDPQLLRDADSSSAEEGEVDWPAAPAQ